MSGKSGRPDRKLGAKGILAVFRDSEPVLKRLLRRISPSTHDVEDITQETILRALEAERAREIKQPRAYLFSIAKNIVYDELEKKSRSIIDFIEDFAPETDFRSEALLDETVEKSRRMLLFWEAVATLPEQCQRVFVMKKVYGYSHQEISQKLGISISTAEKHAAAGLKRCSDFMKERLNEAASEPADPVTAREATSGRSVGNKR